MSFEKAVVISDIHGASKRFNEVVETYINDESVGFVVNGDYIDPRSRISQLKPLMDQLLELAGRVHINDGNHEYVLNAAMHEVHPLPSSDAPSHVKTWVNSYYGNGTVEAYLGPHIMKDRVALGQLKKEMGQLGHLALLGQYMYFENDDILAIHGGLDPRISWTTQKDLLDQLTQATRDQYFSGMPPQLYDFRLSTGLNPQPAGLQKSLVVGHSHRALPGGARFNPDTDTYLISSELHERESLFVLESWTKRVVEFPWRPGY